MNELDEQMREKGDRTMLPPGVYTRRRLLVATAAVVVPALGYSALRRGAAQSESTPVVASVPPSSVAVALFDPGTSLPQYATSTPGPAAGFDHPVGVGMNGTKVSALQDRLRDLSFDPGPSDGLFGPATERAVWAFEKFILGVAADDVTGVVTPDVWGRMSEQIRVRPRRANGGTHLEIILPKQVAVLYRDNVPTLITHISSGAGDEWCSVVVVDEDDGTQSEQGICGVSVTPGGVFHFERRVEGWRNSKLGRLYNPVYFNYGIAVHGATNVPSFPASRGCVRIPMHIAEYFPSLVSNGDLVSVFDGIREPEEYGAQLPVFDYPDPSYSATTSTATSSAPSPATTASSPASPGATTSTSSTSTTHVHPVATSTVDATVPTSTSATEPKQG